MNKLWAKIDSQKLMMWKYFQKYIKMKMKIFSSRYGRLFIYELTFYYITLPLSDAIIKIKYGKKFDDFFRTTDTFAIFFWLAIFRHTRLTMTLFKILSWKKITIKQDFAIKKVQDTLFDAYVNRKIYICEKCMIFVY